MTNVLMHRTSSTIDVVFSESAQQHIKAHLQKNPEYKGLRLSVKKTGCSGYSYVVDYVTIPEQNDKVERLMDDYVLCIDAASHPYLKGMRVDYVKQGLNAKLILENPNQTGQCGCGESFTVE